MTYKEFLELLEELQLDLDSASEALDLEISDIEAWEEEEEIPSYDPSFMSKSRISKVSKSSKTSQSKMKEPRSNTSKSSKPTVNRKEQNCKCCFSVADYFKGK